jgi:hypothetical protein
MTLGQGSANYHLGPFLDNHRMGSADVNEIPFAFVFAIRAPCGKIVSLSSNLGRALK